MAGIKIGCDGPETLTVTLIKKDIHKHMNRCSKSYIIREIQITAIMRYHYTSMRIAKTENTDNIKLWQSCESTETHSFKSLKLYIMQKVVRKANKTATS